ncbi:MAG: DUF6338 family protein [Chloroflexota bacterium]|nr:DUF6338 family protein [Chloroflexota bacterium]
MLPTSIEALLIIALVISPGYLFTIVVRRSVAYAWETSELRLVLTTITAGTLIQLLGSPLGTITIVNHYVAGTLLQNLSALLQWALLVCVALPILSGTFLGWLIARGPVDRVLEVFGLGFYDRTPSAWDYAAQEHDGVWVRIHLKDNQGIIAGKFGQDSFASLDPKRPDIYLQEAWLVDAHGNFVKPVVDSLGVWVAHDVMAYAHFLEGSEAPHAKPNTPEPEPRQQPK